MSISSVTTLPNPVGEAEAQAASPRRLLMVSARYFPYTGGTETHVYEVGRRLAATGDAVTILTTDPSNKLPKSERVENVDIRRVRAYTAKRDYYFAPGLYGTITRGDWQVMHLQGWHTLVAPLAMFAALRAHIPYAVTFHSGGHSSSVRNSSRGIQ